MFPENPYAVYGRLKNSLYFPIITAGNPDRTSPVQYFDLPAGSRVVVKFSIDSEFWPVTIFLSENIFQSEDLILEGWVFTHANLTRLVQSIA